MSDHTLDFSSRRSPVYGRRGGVAASQPLAVAAALETLAAGGNAADAAVATAAALNVTEPTSTGIGGDCFALFYDAQTGRISALNGSGRAPAALTLDRLAAEGFGPAHARGLPPYHPHTVIVPGACAGWCDLVERHGRLPLARILAPAIRLAEEGFPVAPLTAHYWQHGVEQQLRAAPGGLELTLDGRAPRPGEIFRNPGLARTLRAVAEGGKRAYYEGPIAEAIAATLQAAGGCMTVEDLAAHTSTWEQPISIVYRGLRIWECPPNGQGLAALLALNILEGYDLAALDPLAAERLHLTIEAMRLAFADARWYVADPAFSPAPLAELLSKPYAAARRRLIDPRRAAADPRHGAPVAGSDTVYFCVVDAAGNACSFINSNYMGFGTGIVPAGWGFTLQNRGHNFSLDADHPNALAPRKRPYHTIIPALATREADGSLYAAFGVMGGFMQPQGHMQVVVGLADDGLDPQAALDRPRFCIVDGVAGGGVALEEGIPAATLDRLADMGHPVSRVTGYDRAIFGRGQIIRRDPDTGVLCAGSDPRADGCAMCL
ncbi:MAG: putative gamma-glutamyltransferase YwrD [Chloroflexi bacterium ADurb.Bin325]|nr:MAG: putative gamma-glutamyltransferase YwrD [Chloroflexi bacterium ADurb.Bin325]